MSAGKSPRRLQGPAPDPRNQGPPEEKPAGRGKADDDTMSKRMDRGKEMAAAHPDLFGRPSSPCPIDDADWKDADPAEVTAQVRALFARMGR